METITNPKIEELEPRFATKNDLEKIPKVPFAIKLARVYFRIMGNIFPAFVGKQAFRIFQKPRIRAKHRNSDMVLEKAKLFEMLYGKRILKAYEWGSENSPTVLLVHGWESRGTAMRSLALPLVEKGYRVVAFDGPAHGDSGGKFTNLLDFGGAIKALINHLGDVHSIIGHSFGGAATVFTLRHIEPSISIEKFVMVGTPSKMIYVFERFADFIHLPQKALLNVYKEVERLFGFSMEQIDNTKAMDKMNIKEALIIHDRKDRIVPFEEGKETADAWYNAKMLVTNGYGHFKILKKPDVIERVVDFISAK